jgi:hypothetical protein
MQGLREEPLINSPRFSYLAGRVPVERQVSVGALRFSRARCKVSGHSGDPAFNSIKRRRI